MKHTPKLDDSEVYRLADAGHSQREIADRLGVSHVAIGNRLRTRGKAEPTPAPPEATALVDRLVAALSTTISLEPTDDEFVVSVANTRSTAKRLAPIQVTWIDTADGGIEARTEAMNAPAALPSGAAKVANALASVERNADRIEAFLWRHKDEQTPLTVRKCREGANLDGKRWPPAIDLCFKRRTVVEDVVGPSTTYHLVDTSKQPTPTTPGPLPEPGQVASKRLGKFGGVGRGACGAGTGVGHRGALHKKGPASHA